MPPWLHQLRQLLRAEQWRQHPWRYRENRQQLPAGLVQLGELLREKPLIAMGFRFRRSARLGPLRFNFAKSGLSSISVGGRGASFNIPVARSGEDRTTVGLPGTGLSWSVEHTPDQPAVIPASRAEGLPNSRRLRPGQLDALKQELLALLRQGLFAPGSSGALLWEHGSVSRLLTDGTLSPRTSGLLELIETPEAMEGYLLRAQSQDDAKRRAQRCIEAAQEALRLSADQRRLE